MPHQPSPTTKPRPVTYEMDARERAKARAGTLGYSAAPARVVGSPQGSRTISKVARVLSARGRRQIKTENFALPGRRYPIHDEAHARNALARVAQYGTADEKALVRRAVSNRYPGIGQGVEKMAMSRERVQGILEKVAQSQDSMVRRGQGYGAFGSAGHALREATGGATLYPGDLIRRAENRIQLVRKGEVLGEVMQGEKGLGYVSGRGMKFRGYEELPGNQRGLAARSAVPAAPGAAPAAVPVAPAAAPTAPQGTMLAREKQETTPIPGVPKPIPQANVDRARQVVTQQEVNRQLSGGAPGHYGARKVYSRADIPSPRNTDLGQKVVGVGEGAPPPVPKAPVAGQGAVAGTKQ